VFDKDQEKQPMPKGDIGWSERASPLVSCKNGVSIPTPLALAFSCGTKVLSERGGQGLKWNQKGLLWNHFGQGTKELGAYLAW
jgi:hypothetical protein